MENKENKTAEDREKSIEEEDAKGRKMAACIETCPEEWSNRLMVTEL